MIGLFRRSRFLTDFKFSRSVTAGLIANIALRDMGIGSVALFLPVYLYQIGGMGMLVKYMVISRLWDFAISKQIANLIGRMGFKLSMIISSLMMIAGLGIFRYVPDYHRLIYLAAILEPGRGSLFWVTHHLLFLQNRESEMGHKSSWMSIVASWSYILGPIAGGLLITFTGFGGLFGWGMLMVALSCIPVLWIDAKEVRWEISLNKYWEKITDKWFRRDLVAHLGRGIEESMFDVYWPVFLFAILGGSHLALGQYKTSILIVSSVLMFLVGRRLDRYWPKKYLITGIILLILLWFARAWFISLPVVWGLDLIDGLLAVVVLFPFGIYTYHRAKISKAVLYMTEREAILNLGRAATAVGVGVLYMSGLGWNMIAMLAVIGLVLMLFIPDYSSSEITN